MNTIEISQAERLQPKRVILGLALMLSGTLAHGAWVVDPSVSVGTRYDDNVRLTPENEDDAIVTNADLQARVRRLTEISEISALAGFRISKYSKADTIEDDQRETAFAELSAGRRFERSSINLRSSFRRQDLLRNVAIIDDGGISADQADADGGELPEEPDLADDILTGSDPDSGSTRGQVRRTLIRVTPSVNYQLNERTGIDLAYTYTDQSYDQSGSDIVGGGQDDYKIHSGVVRLQRQMSLSDSAWVDAGFARYEPDGAFNSDTDTWSGTLGWRRQLSERMDVEGSVGGRRTDSDFGNDTGFLFNARVDRRTERGRLFAIVSRTYQPNAYGEEVNVDRLRLGMNQGISDRMSWTLSGNLFTTDDSSTGRNNRNQDYANVRASLQRAFTQSWSVRGSYSYTWVDRERDSGSATRNAVELSVVYSPPRRL